MCVLGFEFRLRPTIPGLGVWGVCVGLRHSPVPLQSWLRCAVWVCRFGFWLSTCQSWLEFWDVWFSARALPVPRFLAGLCVVGVRAGVRVSAAPLHSWRGVLGCVRYGAPSTSTTPFLVGACGVCVWVLILAFTPPIQAVVLRCVSLCAFLAPTPPILAEL